MECRDCGQVREGGDPAAAADPADPAVAVADPAVAVADPAVGQADGLASTGEGGPGAADHRVCCRPGRGGCPGAGAGAGSAPGALGDVRLACLYPVVKRGPPCRGHGTAGRDVTTRSP